MKTVTRKERKYIVWEDSYLYYYQNEIVAVNFWFIVIKSRKNF